MAINPLPRVNPLEIPTYLPSAARAPEGAFNNLANLGQDIGDYRRRQLIGEISAAATDANGVVDESKAIALAARAGLVSPEQLAVIAARRQALAQSAAGQRETARHHGAIEEFQNRPRYQYNAPDPILGGGNVIEERPGQPPVIRPWPGATPPPATPGPQSEADLPAAARYAAAGGQDQLPPNFYPRASFDQRFTGAPETPSEGPPYQMAQAGPAPQPAPAAGRNDAYLRALPTDDARTLVKGIADYEIDPASIDARLRAKLLAAAKTYRPDYSASEFQKRGSPPSGEVASRIGLAKAFMDRAPMIRERLQANELNSWEGAAQAIWGQGGPGELRRAIDEGSEALLRGLTGAGMNKDEAANYARRYQFGLRDNKDTALRKLNELENALRYVTTEVGKGRGGEDVLKGFSSQFGQPVTVNAPDKAIRALQSNPALRDEFDTKYGAGAADRVLGARR